MKAKTFNHLATLCDEALSRLRRAESVVHERKQGLNHAETEVRQAQEQVAKARDELFEAYPEMRPSVGGQRVDTPHVPADDTPPFEFRESG